MVDGFICSDRRGLQGRRGHAADVAEPKLAGSRWPVGGRRTGLLTLLVINQNTLGGHYDRPTLVRIERLLLLLLLLMMNLMLLQLQEIHHDNKRSINLPTPFVNL